MEHNNDKGWIALDIDGTLTADVHCIPSQVVERLFRLQKEGWRIVFVTGRTFSLSHRVLKVCAFPHYIIVQNGADTLKMPEEQLIDQRYLSHAALAAVEEAYKGREEDFLVYAGYKKGDFCYFRPRKFSRKLLAYLEKLKAFAPAEWRAVEDFNGSVEGHFPLIKCLGTQEDMQAVSRTLQSCPSLHVTYIRDGVCPDLYINLVTDVHATKGDGLGALIAQSPCKGPIIAAGDDLNDATMLERADIKIVMETAPKELLEIATIVAPAAARCGILDGLQEALQRLGSN
jgi:HAD superfamily hydrolase (TIGR01484 family)